ncbi:hypothetical protein [Streptosporangium vulgare]
MAICTALREEMPAEVVTGAAAAVPVVPVHGRHGRAGAGRWWR